MFKVQKGSKDISKCWRRTRMHCALFTSREMHTRASWCREHMAETDTEDNTFLNKVVFLCAQKVLS